MENIEKIIKELKERIIELEHKVHILMKEPQKEVNNNSKERDKTKFMFEGTVYSKNQLVLAVVKAYVKQHPNIGFLELSKVFDKSLQGSLGVVQQWQVAEQKADAKKRYYMNDVIVLKNDKVVVCTQWGAFNIFKFILRAKELHFQITEL